MNRNKKSSNKLSIIGDERVVGLSMFGPLCCAQRGKDVGPTDEKKKSVKEFADSFGMKPLYTSRSAVKLPPIDTVVKPGGTNSKTEKPLGSLMNPVPHNRSKYVGKETSFLDLASKKTDALSDKKLQSSMNLLLITSDGAQRKKYLWGDVGKANMSKQDTVDLNIVNVEGGNELLKKKP